MAAGLVLRGRELREFDEFLTEYFDGGVLFNGGQRVDVLIHPDGLYRRPHPNIRWIIIIRGNNLSLFGCN